MLETMQDKYEDLRQRAEDRGWGSEPNGRNAGITPPEAAIAFAAALGATFIARNLLQSGWRAALDRDPPKNPASSEVDWSDAMLWGGVSGALVGLVRIASRRAASSVYRRF